MHFGEFSNDEFNLIAHKNTIATYVVNLFLNKLLLVVLFLKLTRFVRVPWAAIPRQFVPDRRRIEKSVFLRRLFAYKTFSGSYTSQTKLSTLFDIHSHARRGNGRAFTAFMEVAFISHTFYVGSNDNQILCSFLRVVVFLCLPPSPLFSVV